MLEFMALESAYTLLHSEYASLEIEVRAFRFEDHLSKIGESCSLVIIGMESELTIATVIRLEKTLFSLGISWSLLPLPTVHHFHQLLEKFKCEHFNGSVLHLNGAQAEDAISIFHADLEPSADFTEWAWGSCVVEGHGDNAHSKLGSLVICSAPESSNGICSGTRCHVAEAAGTAGYSVDAIRAEVFFFMQCNSFFTRTAQFPLKGSLMMSAFARAKAVFATTHAVALPIGLGHSIMRLLLSGLPLGKIKDAINDIYQRLFSIRPVVLLGNPGLKVDKPRLSWVAKADLELPPLIDTRLTGIELRGQSITYTAEDAYENQGTQHLSRVERYLGNYSNLLDQWSAIRESRKSAAMEPILSAIVRNRTFIKGYLNSLKERLAMGTIDTLYFEDLSSEIETEIQRIDLLVLEVLAQLPRKTDLFDQIDNLYRKRGIPAEDGKICSTCQNLTFSYRVPMSYGFRIRKICPTCGPLSIETEGGIQLEVIGPTEVMAKTSWSWFVQIKSPEVPTGSLLIEVEERYSKRKLVQTLKSYTKEKSLLYVMVPETSSDVPSGFHTLRLISCLNGEIAMFRRKIFVREYR